MIADKEIIKQRTEICSKCPYMKFSIFGMIAKCSECGCPIQTKAAIDNSSCPKGKW